MAILIKQHKATQRSTGAKEPVIAQTIKVERAAASLPATATQTIYNITGGYIKLLGLVGEVTTAIQNQACNLSVNVDSDAGASDVIASTLDIANDAVGTYYGVEGDGTAVEDTGIGWGKLCVQPVLVGPGIITITTSATNTGAIKWTLLYEPVDPTASVAAA